MSFGAGVAVKSGAKNEKSKSIRQGNAGMGSILGCSCVVCVLRDNDWIKSMKNLLALDKKMQKHIQRNYGQELKVGPKLYREKDYNKWRYETIAMRKHRKLSYGKKISYQFGINTYISLILLVTIPANAQIIQPAIPTADAMCDAIYLAEGGEKAKKPYGVLSVPCDSEASCRQICLNSHRNNIKRFYNQDKYDDFVEFFGTRWAPVGAKNDPTGLNRNWVKNVKWFLENRREKE